MERVSIVIPCYNSGATIAQTVASAKAQTWQDVEIIVVDDGSTDPATIELLNALDGVHLVRQKNAGLPAARNAGFTAASGIYVLPLDADDWLEPDAVAAMLDAMKAPSGASFVFSHLQLEGEASGVLVKPYNFFEQLFLNQMPYCILLPKELWCQVGGYEQSIHCQGYEDWEFNIRLGAAGYYGVVVPRPLFHYRVTSGGMLISQSNRVHGSLWAEIQSRHEPVYRLSRLFQLWREWRGRPSTYPLGLYFVWLFAFRVMPPSLFAWVFRTLRRCSHSRRVTARSRIT